MKVIHHKDRPLLEFPDEPWRQSLLLAVNRSAGSNSLSVWLAEMGDHHRTPLHWHDTEEVLVFLEVDGDGFARLVRRNIRSKAKQAWWFLQEPFMRSASVVE